MCSITLPYGHFQKLIFVVIFQPIRRVLEFWGRLSEFSLSSKTANKCQNNKQLSYSSMHHCSSKGPIALSDFRDPTNRKTRSGAIFF